MPRVENCGANVSAYCEESGEGSSTYDLCSYCASELEDDPHAHDAVLEPYNGDPHGDDGWDGDVEHPCYSEDDYRCEVCSSKLGRRDN